MCLVLAVYVLGLLATVITSLATAIPVVGKSIMYWLWGGFSVDNPTLNRFYSFHYTLPFVLAGLSVFHIAALHQYGSTNPLGINSQSSSISFGTYFGTKDLLGALFMALVFSYLIFFNPDLLGHPDNLIPANPYQTPQHIVPEWYVLFIYAILRSIPNKTLGVLFVGLAFISIAIQPFLNSGTGGRFRIMSEWLFFMFVADCGLLTWLGAQNITPSTMLVGQLCTLFFFGYLLVLVPMVSHLEYFILHNSSRTMISNTINSYFSNIGMLLFLLLSVLSCVLGLIYVGYQLGFNFNFSLSFNLFTSGFTLFTSFVLPVPILSILDKRTGQMVESIFVVVLTAKGYIPLQMTSKGTAAKFQTEMALNNIKVEVFYGSKYNTIMDYLVKGTLDDIQDAIESGKSVPSDLSGILLAMPASAKRLEFNKSIILDACNAPVITENNITLFGDTKALSNSVPQTTKSDPTVNKTITK